MHWTTIESAPTDTWIVLYDPSWPRPSVGKWMKLLKKFYSEEYGYEKQPTMWCPLPYWEKK